MKLRFSKPVIYRSTLSGFALILLIILAPLSLRAEVVDRVVANVNGHVVLQSDWEQEISFEAFSNSRDPNSFSKAERSAALDRLIDQELLREQLRPVQVVPPGQVAASLVGVRKLHPECDTDAKWQAALRNIGMTEESLTQRLADQIQLMKLVEERLRPSIQIDQAAVEAYYRDQLLPEMKRAGNSAAPLTEVFARIKDLLAEKKMNELLSGWLASLRSSSQILSPASSIGEQNR
jgi:peptidyl-prolyl cis-trans isomerase SurA